jgi:hypothetical protein
MIVVGIDCATVPKKVGIALAVGSQRGSKRSATALPFECASGSGETANEPETLGLRRPQ